MTRLGLIHRRQRFYAFMRIRAKRLTKNSLIRFPRGNHRMPAIFSSRPMDEGRAVEGLGSIPGDTLDELICRITRKANRERASTICLLIRVWEKSGLSENASCCASKQILSLIQFPAAAKERRHVEIGVSKDSECIWKYHDLTRY